jgi:polyribonucleotide nucleotidyltransferase
VVNLGDKLRVEIADIDKRGKISLVLVSEEDGPSDNGAAPADPAPEAAPADAASPVS